MNYENVNHVIKLVNDDLDFIINHISDVNPIDYEELHVILSVYHDLLRLKLVKELFNEDQN